MRTIVAFLFVATLGAQTQIELQEKKLAQNPDNLAQRGVLLRLYATATDGREARRRHILWLIEHHPDAPDLGDPVGIIDLTDPDGHAEAARLWREQASKPDASPKTIANAVFFFKTSDRATAVALLDPAWRAHPHDPALARSKGMLDVLIFLGATPEAKQALEEIEDSTNADLLGSAGDFLRRQTGFTNRDVPAMRDHALDLAERWLSRAHALDPKNDAWTASLLQVFRSRASGASDPRERVKLLADAVKLANNDTLLLAVLPDLANAEFEARDDPAAERDARRLLELAKGRGNLIHQADTLLGRVALARGDTKSAREWLFASIQLKDVSSLKSGGPRMDLAQDLLDVGDRDAVLRFLEQCRSVWVYDRGNLDYFERLFKVKGTPNLLERWRPSGAVLVRQKAPTLDQFAGKVIALLFRNTSCKACLDELPVVEEFAKERDVMVLSVNPDDPAIRQYRVETFPTLVVIDRSGQIAAYAAGNTDDATLRAQIEIGVNGLPEKPGLPAPKQLAALAWEPVEGAESYIVEWDYRDGNGWIFDRDKSLRVIPTRETSVPLDLIDVPTGRWRVYAVPRAGAPGKTSDWKQFP